MNQTLDLLLQVDEAKLIKPRREVEIKRLSESVGQKVVFTCEAITPAKMAEIQEMVMDVRKQEVDIPEMQLMTVLAGVKEPNLKSNELLDKFKAPTPKELLLRLLLPGEIQSLYNIISELSGYGEKAVEEVKN